MTSFHSRSVHNVSAKARLTAPTLAASSSATSEHITPVGGGRRATSATNYAVKVASIKQSGVHQTKWRASKRQVASRGIMSDAIDRALSENHALIAAILEHQSSGRHVPAVALLERLQVNLEFVAALSEQGVPIADPTARLPPTHAHPVSRPVLAPPRIAPAPPIVPLVTQPPSVATMYWSPDEHARFQDAMVLYAHTRDGKPDFKAIATHVATRTPVQVRSHWQKVQKRSRKDPTPDDQLTNVAPSHLAASPPTALPPASLSTVAHTIPRAPVPHPSVPSHPASSTTTTRGS